MPQTTRRERKYLKNFGITMDDYERMLESQHELCAICGHICMTYANLTVDHDHETGEVRGLLCRSCNLKLEWLIQHGGAAMNYLNNPPARAILAKEA